MKTYRRFAAVIAACLWVLALRPATAQTPASGSEIAVVVNQQNPLTEISSAELRHIFRGDIQHWKSNIPVQVLIRAPQSTERTVVLSKLLGLSEGEYKQYWIGKLYRGEVDSPPTEVPSNALAAEGVRALPGAIACIKARDVPNNVKILKVDGRLPGEKGYPLHLD